MWHGIVSFGYFFSLEAKLQDLTDWLIVGIVDSSENEAFILVIGFVMDGLHALTVEDCIYGLWWLVLFAVSLDGWLGPAAKVEDLLLGL